MSTRSSVAQPEGNLDHLRVHRAHGRGQRARQSAWDRTQPVRRNTPPRQSGGGGGGSTEGGAHTGNTGYTSVQPTPVHTLGQCGGGKDAQKVASSRWGGGRAGYARHQPPPVHPPKQRGGAAHAKTSSKTTKNGPPTFLVGGTSSRWAARNPGERTGRSIPETHVTPTSHFFW